MTDGNLDLCTVEPQDHNSPSPPLLPRLRQSLLSWSEAFETEDFQRSDKVVAQLVDLLDSAVESTPPPPDSDEALLEIHRFLSSPESNQMAVDALSLTVPRAVVKFAGVSDRCREVAESIIDCLVSICSPRDMLSILLEALDSFNKVSKAPIHFVLLLNRLSKVLSCIKRQHVQQVKATLPVVLDVLQAVLLDYDKKHRSDISELVTAAVTLATSIQAISENMVGEMKQKMHAILGLYVLQIMALISKSDLANEVSDCVPFVVNLSLFLPLCGLSYIGLVAGSDVDEIIGVSHEDGGDDLMSHFSFLKDGASLAVIWGCISGEIAKAAGEQLITVIDNLRSNQTRRWQAVSMLRYVLSSLNYPWVIKFCTIDLLSDIMDGRISEDSNDVSAYDTSTMLNLYSCLKAIEKVVMYAPDASLRKKAFATLKKVLSDLPSSEQFDMLMALITNSNSPSMIAILVDIVKEKVLIENRQRVSLHDEITNRKNKACSSTPLWCSSALELVELILKPPKGGPPSLPEYSEPVLSALNLYRFILLTESTGKINCSAVLSKTNLQKAYEEWLLPLRTLVSGIEAENKNDDSDITCNILCSLNPVQLVLYRCIELVEDTLRHLK